MPYAPIMHGKTLIEIERDRYDELIAEEKELQLLKKAFRNMLLFSELETIKRLFDITPEIKESEEINNA